MTNIVKMDKKVYSGIYKKYGKRAFTKSGQTYLKKNKIMR